MRYREIVEATTAEKAQKAAQKRAKAHQKFTDAQRKKADARRSWSGRTSFIPPVDPTSKRPDAVSSGGQIGADIAKLNSGPSSRMGRKVKYYLMKFDTIATAP